MNVEYIIETHNLSKRYQRGKTLALDNLNLKIPKGSLFGFVGPNGAGKTTTLRMLAGLLEPSSGEIFVAGESVRQHPHAIHHHIGYMPDFFGVYQEMTAWEYLDFFARCHDIPARQRKTVTEELLELVGLSEKRDADVGHLSRGMQQRLCLAHALVHDPQVLLLDEPASGLDPRARVEMRALLHELSAMGKTIILSSHILSELAEMCDEVGIIQHGKMAASGPLTTLRQRSQVGRMLRLHILSDIETAITHLEQYPGLNDVMPLNNGHNNGNGNDETWLEAYFPGDAKNASELLANLVENDIVVAEFRQVGNELEELFLQFTDQQN